MRSPPGLDMVHSFLVLAEELNFRRAAARLNINQSALTRRIQKLEFALGLRLLERTTRDVRLTPAGRSYYEDGARLLDGYDASVDTARRIAGGRTGLLRVAYMSFAISPFLSVPVRGMQDEHPEIVLSLKYMRTAAQKLAIVNDDTDLGFLLGRFDHPEFRTLELPDERLHLVFSRDHPLAAQPAVSPRVLHEHGLVTGDLAEWGDYRRHLEDLFAQEGVLPRVNAQTSHVLAQVGLIASGVGVGILPESLARLVGHAVDSRPFASERFVVSQTLAWRSADKAAPLRRFVELVRQAIREASKS